MIDLHIAEFILLRVCKYRMNSEQGFPSVSNSLSPLACREIDTAIRRVDANITDLSRYGSLTELIRRLVDIAEEVCFKLRSEHLMPWSVVCA